MGRIRSNIESIKKDQRGFTLPELLTTIAILGILLAIAIIIWLGLLEQRRVTAAANQLAADMRLTHGSATNQLTDWRVVLDPGKADENLGADYRLAKLSGVYNGGSTPAEAEPPTPRTFPANVKIVNISGGLDTDITPPTWMTPTSVANRTRTIEFNSDGTLKWYQASSGSTCVTVDGDPRLKVTALSVTSRVEIKDEACS